MKLQYTQNCKRGAKNNKEKQEVCRTEETSEKALGCFVDAEVYSKRSRKRHLCHHDDKAETATN